MGTFLKHLIEQAMSLPSETPVYFQESMEAAIASVEMSRLFLREQYSVLGED